MNLKPCFRMQILAGILISLSCSCGKSKTTDGGEKSGQTDAVQTADTSKPAGDKTTKPAGDATNPAKPGAPAPAAPVYTVPELISKMSWKAIYYNNEEGKAFTGFDGQTAFKIHIDLGVTDVLPKDIVLTDAQAQALYDSPEYLAAAKIQVAKLSLTSDPAMMSSKMIEEYEVGRVYELVSVKAGTTVVKGKFDATELPLTVQITAYTPAQVAAGKTRYTTAVAGATPSPSCASCHQTPKGVDHSPYYMAQYTDAAIQSTVETGLNSDDKYQTKVPHKMTFAGAADKAGIVAFLRSLDPATAAPPP